MRMNMNGATNGTFTCQPKIHHTNRAHYDTSQPNSYHNNRSHYDTCLLKFHHNN